MFKKGPIGCLLVHGFTGVPYEMREMGEFLAQRGITVSGPALAGHATHHTDMAHTVWQDWYSSARAALDELKSMCERTFVAGLSMGGLTTLHLATHDRDIAGAIPMAAPVFIRNWQVSIMKPIMQYTPLKWLHRFHRNPPTVFFDPEAEKTHVCYSHVPISCVLSLLDYMRHVHEDLAEITAPLLIMQSVVDPVVPPGNMEIIYNAVSSKDKELVKFEKSYHVITRDLDKAMVFEKTFEFIKSRA